MGSPCRILFVSHSASRTGAPLLLNEIAAALDREKYKPSFILGDDGPLRSAFEALDETIIDPLYPDEIKYWRELKRFGRRRAILRSLNPHIVYCNTIHTAKWLPYAKLMGIPTIAHVHELKYGFATVGPVERYFLRRYADCVVAVSDAVRSYLELSEGVRPERITTIRAGIEPARFMGGQRNEILRESIGLKGEFVIGCVGRVTPMKGTDMLPALVRLLVERAPGLDFKLLVVASTDDRASYQQFLQTLEVQELADRVVVIPDAVDTAPYYGSMDVFLSTAREDPFPLVVLEAMASGLPVVSFRVGGIPEAVDESTGILIEPFNLNEMAAALVQLAGDPARRRGMGAEGRARVHRDFDLAKNIGTFQALIESTLANHA